MGTIRLGGQLFFLVAVAVPVYVHPGRLSPLTGISFIRSHAVIYWGEKHISRLRLRQFVFLLCAIDPKTLILIYREWVRTLNTACWVESFSLKFPLKEIGRGRSYYTRPLWNKLCEHEKRKKKIIPDRKKIELCPGIRKRISCLRFREMAQLIPFSSYFLFFYLASCWY